MKQRWLILFAAFLVTAALGCKKNETYKTETATTNTTVSDTSGTTSTSSTAVTGMDPKDSDFVTKAAQGGMTEVQVSQAAQSRSTNSDVKAFADRMVNDHSKANDELKSLASTKSVPLPSDLDAEHKKMVDDLSAKNGKDFDMAYMKGAVDAHEKTVKLFETESKDAKDADLKAWVTKTLPTLKDHLKMAKETEKKVK